MHFSFRKVIVCVGEQWKHCGVKVNVKETQLLC